MLYCFCKKKGLTGCKLITWIQEGLRIKLRTEKSIFRFYKVRLRAFLDRIGTILAENVIMSCGVRF